METLVINFRQLLQHIVFGPAIVGMILLSIHLAFRYKKFLATIITPNDKQLFERVVFYYVLIFMLLGLGKAGIVLSASGYEGFLVRSLMFVHTLFLFGMVSTAMVLVLFVRPSKYPGSGSLAILFYGSLLVTDVCVDLCINIFSDLTIRTMSPFLVVIIFVLGLILAILRAGRKGLTLNQLLFAKKSTVETIIKETKERNELKGIMENPNKNNES